VGSDNPKETFGRTQALDVHFAIPSGRQVDQSIQWEVLVISEAAIAQVSQTFDACSLVAGEKEAVADPCDG
jgi:hypothetical protein